jgi:hypothetical protein
MAKKIVNPIATSSEPMSEAKRAVLDKALGDIIKRYGEGSIMRLGEAHQLAVEVIPTGSLSLDIALGVGGIPRGRITEIYGPESQVKQPSAFTLLPKPKSLAAPLPSLIWNTPSTRLMLPGWVWMWKACSFLNPTWGNRHSKSP